MEEYLRVYNTGPGCVVVVKEFLSRLGNPLKIMLCNFLYLVFFSMVYLHDYLRIYSYVRIVGM